MASAAPTATAMSPEVDAACARLLCSFVPALMLDAMGESTIEPPTTHDYEAVALFAVRACIMCPLARARRRVDTLACTIAVRRTSPASPRSTSTLRSSEATASVR